MTKPPWSLRPNWLLWTTSAERTQQITVSRPAEGRKQLLVLTPQRPTHALFSSEWSTFMDYLVMGAEHIVLLMLVAIAIVRIRDHAGLEFARNSASLLAIGMGSIWFVQRVI